MAQHQQTLLLGSVSKSETVSLMTLCKKHHLIHYYQHPREAVAVEKDVVEAEGAGQEAT